MSFYVLEFRLKNKENTENTKFREQEQFSDKTKMVFSCFQKLFSRTVFINRNWTDLNTLTSTPKAKQVPALSFFFLFAMVDNDTNYLGLL